MSFVIILRNILRWFGWTYNMCIIYLANILHKILIYSKYTLFSITILSRLFIIIRIFEYKSNMVVHINIHL
jgi:hypothetical protein